MSFILPERGEFSEEAEIGSIGHFQKRHLATVWTETRGSLEVITTTQMKDEGFDEDHAGWDGKRMDLRTSWEQN